MNLLPGQFNSFSQVITSIFLFSNWKNDFYLQIQENNNFSYCDAKEPGHFMHKAKKKRSLFPITRPSPEKPSESKLFIAF